MSTDTLPPAADLPPIGVMDLELAIESGDSHWSAVLERLGACDDAVKWARGITSPALACKACERADWMLWIVGRMSGTRESERRRHLVLVACRCARTALPHAKSPRALEAIELAERWASVHESVTFAMLRSAYAAADAAGGSPEERDAVYDSERLQALRRLAYLVRPFYRVGCGVGGGA